MSSDVFRACDDCLDPAECPSSGCARELFGGPAPPIERTPEELEALERHLAYVAKYGHQP